MGTVEPSMWTGAPALSVFHKLLVPQIEASKRTCAVTGGCITVDKSRTTVFRFLVFDGPAGGGSGAPTGSVDGSIPRSIDAAGVESLWPSPACFLFFFFCVWGIVDWFVSAGTLVLAASLAVTSGTVSRSPSGSGGAGVIAELFTADID